MAKLALSNPNVATSSQLSKVGPIKPSTLNDSDTKRGKVGTKPALIQELDEPQPPQRTNQRVKIQKTKETTVATPLFNDSSLPCPSQPYSQSTIAIPSSSEITLATLEKLIRQLPAGMHEILFNLDARKLPALFGKFGFDSAFLSVFLDAVMSAQAEEPNWVHRSVLILDSLRQCGRFNIALTFIPGDKIRRIFEALESHAADSDERKRIQEVKRIYIE